MVGALQARDDRAVGAGRPTRSGASVRLDAVEARAAGHSWWTSPEQAASVDDRFCRTV